MDIIYITTPDKRISDKNTDTDKIPHTVKRFTGLQEFTRFCMSPYQNYV